MAKKSSMSKKVTRKVASANTPVTKKQPSAKQLASLKKAREAKAKYAELRKSGFTRENAGEASELIEKELDRLNAATGGYNPAVVTLLSETGGLRNQEEINKMSNKEYYRYATSLRVFLTDSYSSVSEAEERAASIIEEASYGLIRQKKERKSAYMKRRKAFINENEELAKKAFRLYRELENTSAGQILRSKYSPVAYGSDNLIVDLFDFVENEYDDDFNAAVTYWQGLLDEQVASSTYEKMTGGSLSKFNWRRESNYQIYKRIIERKG